jgi:uncharacterized membrane protein
MTTAKNERDIDIAISHILRLGVLLSSVLCAIGGAGLIAQDWDKPTHIDAFDDQLKSIHGILELVSQGHPEGIIQLGVLVLISTPILRVAFAGLAFLKERDYVYVAIAFLVLSGLIYGLLFS